MWCPKGEIIKHIWMFVTYEEIKHPTTMVQWEEERSENILLLGYYIISGWHNI